MTSDIERRKAGMMWFDGETPDADGNPISMYSWVALTGPVSQRYAEDEPPMMFDSGEVGIVTGSVEDEPTELWVEIDDGGSSPSDVIIPSSKLRVVPEPPRPKPSRLKRLLRFLRLRR